MNAIAGSSVLVVGATGFIGSQVVRRLIEGGARVRVLMRRESITGTRLEGLDVESARGDLRDAESLREAVRGVERIIHAGSVKHGHWEDIERVNLRGTESLVRAAVGERVRRFLLVGDIEVHELAGIPRDGWVEEDSPRQRDRRRMGDYAYSKLENERVLHEARSRKGLGITVIRPGMVIGPTGDVFFPQLGYRFGSRFFVVGGGSNVLPLIYIDDLADAIVQAAHAEQAEGEVYNLVDDPVVTPRSYLDRFLRTTGTSGRIRSIPYAFPYLATTAYEGAAALGLVRRGITSRARFQWKFARVRFSNAKARTHLAWVPRVSIEEGLDRTFRWHAASRAGGSGI